VATDVIGVSGRAMLEALVAGTHDPAVLAALAKGRLRTKLPALREALAGRFRTDHHGLLVAQILAHIDYLDETIATLSARIQQVIGPFAEQVALLDTIPGVDRRAAEVILAEIGPDRASSPLRPIWPRGPGCVRGTTSRPASIGRGGPVRVPSGWAAA
jgi:transposase